MSRADFRRRQSRRRRQKLARMSRHLPTLILLLAITVLVGGGIFALYRFVLAKQPDGTVQVIAFAVSSCNPTLIGHKFKERKSQHQVLQIFNLIETGGLYNHFNIISFNIINFMNF